MHASASPTAFRRGFAGPDEFRLRHIAFDELDRRDALTQARGRDRSRDLGHERAPEHRRRKTFGIRAAGRGRDVLAQSLEAIDRIEYRHDRLAWEKHARRLHFADRDHGFERPTLA